MFVAIDMDNLRILHKGDDHDALSALSWLECGIHTSVAIENTAREHFLVKWGRLDLCILYKNTTGAGLVSQRDEVLRAQLRELIDATPAAPVDKDEVLAQVDAVDERIRAGERFSYARGSRVPSQPRELFPLVAKPLGDARLMRVEQATPEALTRSDQLAAPPPPPVTVVRSRASNVRAPIWAHADAAWEAAGKPMDSAVVLEMRKVWYKELEASHGYNKHTCSNELAKWMKIRLAPPA